MINSPTIRRKIEEGKTGDILRIVEESKTYWKMQSFNQSLAELVKANKVTKEEARSASPNPHDLELKLKGTFEEIIIG
jgi:Tfp pilus assembly pilus retraction ATPase PilT